MSNESKGTVEAVKEAVQSAAEKVGEALGLQTATTEEAKSAEPGSPAGFLESADDAEKHRLERGDPEPRSPRKSGLGRHIDIGGVADFGPVDTERMSQPDTRVP